MLPLFCTKALRDFSAEEFIAPFLSAGSLTVDYILSVLVPEVRTLNISNCRGQYSNDFRIRDLLILMLFRLRCIRAVEISDEMELLIRLDTGGGTKVIGAIRTTLLLWPLGE